VRCGRATIKSHGGRRGRRDDIETGKGLEAIPNNIRGEWKEQLIKKEERWNAKRGKGIVDFKRKMQAQPRKTDRHYGRGGRTQDFNNGRKGTSNWTNLTDYRRNLETDGIGYRKRPVTRKRNHSVAGKGETVKGKRAREKGRLTSPRPGGKVRGSRSSVHRSSMLERRGQ